MVAAAPAKGPCGPADLSASLPNAGWLTVHARRHPREVCPVSRGVMSRRRSTPIRPITGRRSLAPPSFTRSPIGSSYDSLSLAGGLRAYHVAPLKPRGLGPASAPVARHLRRVSSEHPGLATYRLVQACQHLGLVLCDDAGGGSPGLTLPRPPGPRPPWCWPSQPGLAPPLPSRGMRIRCPEGFAPPVARDARLGRRLLAEQQVLSPPSGRATQFPRHPRVAPERLRSLAGPAARNVMSRQTVMPARSSATLCYPAIRRCSFSLQPCRLTIALIQIGAKGDVQPFETG